jgi:hypothetical protein
LSAGFGTTPFYAFIMQLTVEERVFILESYVKTMSYVHCRQRFFLEKLEGRQFARPKAVEDEYYSCHRRSE